MVLVNVRQSDGSTIEVECANLSVCPLIEGHFVLEHLKEMVGTGIGNIKTEAWSIPRSVVTGYIRGMREADLTDGKILSPTEAALYRQRQREEVARQERAAQEVMDNNHKVLEFAPPTEVQEAPAKKLPRRKKEIPEA